MNPILNKLVTLLCAIYADYGTSEISIQGIEEFFRSHSTENYLIKTERWTASDIINQHLQTKCPTWLVIPGGRDLPYLNRLGKKGCEEIEDFVKKGGTYIGICAGAYFACDSISFAKDTAYEVIGKRHLNLTLAKGVGPINPNFSYSSEEGSEAIQIRFSRSISNAYVNGGCWFENLEKDPTVEVIATYPDRKIAIISKRVESGKIILMGPHLEISGKMLGQKSHHLASALVPFDQKRSTLLASIIF